jgi:hypothetical protein
MADVLAAVADLELRCGIHQETEGFYADNREGRRAVLALHTIEETEWAIRAYRKPRVRRLSQSEIVELRARGNQYPGVGSAYLAKYGLLQAMQLQQLASETVAVALGFAELKLQASNMVRLARHNAVGHPFSNRGAQEDHFLDRSSILDNVLKVMSFRPDGSWYGRTEQIPALKRMQREIVAGYLSQIIEAVDTKFRLPHFRPLSDGRIEICESGDE